MIFTISAVIKLDPDRGIVLSKPLEYSPSGEISVSTSNNKEDHNQLDVSFSIKTETSDQAQFVANNELLKLVNILSWERSLPIKKFRVTSVQYSTKKDNQNMIVLVDTIRLSDHVSLSVSLNKQGIKILTDKLSTYDELKEDVIMMWREAISEESKTLQFLLLFRILEYLNGGREGADVYIRKKQPDVKLKKDRRGEVSIYTYLRDNVHAKNPEFPFKEFKNLLPSLSSLVRGAVQNYLDSK